MPASAETDTETDQRYEVAIRRDVRIPAREEGQTLSADLFLPDGAGAVPVLVTALPYRRDIAGLTGFPTERWFAARGYASLLVDLRGTGSSDGLQRPPFDPGDADDALDAIRWAIRQPWCTGSVGMWGGSYGAITTLRTAALRPAALRAIIAIEGTADPGRDFVHPGGTRGAFSPLGSWSLSTLFNQLLPPVDDYADTAEQTRWHRRLTAAPYLLDLFRNGPGSAVWTERAIDTTAIEVPALCVAGWRDLFVDGTVRAYEDIDARKRLIAGPWMHVMPHECPFTPIDFLPIARAWWDRWLLPTPPRVEEPSPVTLYVQGERPRWIATDSWPPPGSTQVEDLSTWLRAAPEEPDPVVGLRSGLWSTPAGQFGLPLDQHEDDSLSLTYTSPPLAEPLLIGGRPVVEVDDAWPRVSVKLADVDPAGRSLLVCAGIATGAGQIALTPTTYQVAATHRLRVVVAPGDFPRVWPQKPPNGAWPTATTLSLPIVTGSPREAGFAAPEPETTELDIGEGPGEQAAFWEVTEDLLHHTVSLRLAGGNRIGPGDLPGDVRAPAPGLTHTVDVHQELVTTGHRLDPEESTVTGRITGTVDTATGARITVDVSLTATAESIEAGGRVELDGVPLLDRVWRD